jgi:predicted transcriptional regulator
MQVNLLIRVGKRESNSHRGRLDIIADILAASRDGVRKTFLMYHCNLSFKQLQFYSRFLLTQGFLRVTAQENSTNSGSFEVTGKGKQFLKAYKGLKSLMQ